jgi:hypothetical protein
MHFTSSNVAQAFYKLYQLNMTTVMENKCTKLRSHLFILNIYIGVAINRILCKIVFIFWITTFSHYILNIYWCILAADHVTMDRTSHETV